MKVARKLVHAQDEYDGDKFFSYSSGVRRATTYSTQSVASQFPLLSPSLFGMCLVETCHLQTNHQQ